MGAGATFFGAGAGAGVGVGVGVGAAAAGVAAPTAGGADPPENCVTTWTRMIPSGTCRSRSRCIDLDKRSADINIITLLGEYLCDDSSLSSTHLQPFKVRESVSGRLRSAPRR